MQTFVLLLVAVTGSIRKFLIYAQFSHFKSKPIKSKYLSAFCKRVFISSSVIHKHILTSYLALALPHGDDTDLIWTDESLEEFNNEFNVIDLTSDSEKQQEAARLKQVEAEVNEQNSKYAKGEASFGEKLYPFSDWSEEEFEDAKLGMRGWDPSRGDAPPERSMGMVIPPESERNTPENQANLNRIYKQLEGRALPRSYSNPKYVTAPKNQGNCGSCVAFAASGLHEVCMAKAGAPKKGLDLSEQFLVDCGYDGK